MLRVGFEEVRPACARRRPGPGFGQMLVPYLEGSELPELNAVAPRRVSRVTVQNSTRQRRSCRRGSLASMARTASTRSSVTVDINRIILRGGGARSKPCRIALAIWGRPVIAAARRVRCARCGARQAA